MSDAPPATVYLVGAGPGDPGLMSARALELVALADVILYDRLIPDDALAGARADAELVFVGKGGHSPSVDQQEIERLLIDHARAGRETVRLKGGDPFIFGRGGEEALALRGAGIPFEIVPGVTAGIAAPAYAGIPVTQRSIASAVAFVTGHEDPVKAGTSVDWDSLAAFPGTLVLYMGVGRLDRIAGALIAAGRAQDEPVAVIESGTTGAQRCIGATLATIGERAREAGVRAPAVTVVGAVSALAGELAWFDPGPLAGLAVAVTRPRAKASPLARRLGALGARVVQAPVIETRALEGPAIEPAPYDLICVTSPTGVEQLFARLALGGLDARALAGATIAAVGPASARALAQRGIQADVVPERSVAEALAEALSGGGWRRALVARPLEARDVLARSLRAEGVEVDEVALYETVAAKLAEPVLAQLAQCDYVTFTSSSTVTHLLSSVGGPQALGTARIASIGPVTSETLREHGLTVDIEADKHDVDGLIEALLRDAAGDR